MTKNEIKKIAQNIMDIRKLGKNAQTRDGQNQSEAACDCIAYAIASDVLKSQDERDYFLRLCDLRK